MAMTFQSRISSATTPIRIQPVGHALHDEAHFQQAPSTRCPVWITTVSKNVNPPNHSAEATMNR